MADLTTNLEAKYRQIWYQYYNQRKAAKTEGQRGSRSSIEKEHRHPDSCYTLRWAMARESSISLSGSSNWFDAFMQFWVNPSECSWQVPLRSATHKTSGGAVHYEIPQASFQSPFSRFDLPVLNIKFQAGITTQGGYNHIDNGNLEDVIPHGLTNFYDFMSLLDQPNLTNSGEPNFVNIMYVSPVHGSRGIWLRGFFEESGVSWTDNADNPNTINNWSASFIVCTSNPPLNKLKGNFENFGLGG
jgi:hypothetical protein